jgi:hypothetical protein
MRQEFITTVKESIQFFWGVKLCCRVRTTDVSKNLDAFIFGGQAVIPLALLYTEV